MSSKGIEVEKFSKLRIQNPVLSCVELINHLSDIRFAQLPTIKTLLVGDTLSGCWATIGVLSRKLAENTSSIGHKFTIWKMACLDEETVSPINSQFSNNVFYRGKSKSIKFARYGAVLEDKDAFKGRGLMHTL
ncbi:hypothetical protein ACS0TY_032728 [Phlomoides rotata]